VRLLSVSIDTICRVSDLVVADLCDEPQVERAVAEIVERHGRIDGDPS
jgi:hypothetical protein